SPGEYYSSGHHEGVTTMRTAHVPANIQGEHATPLVAPPVTEQVPRNEYASFAHDLRDFAHTQQIKFSRQEQTKLFACFRCYQAQQRELLASGRATLLPGGE